MVVDFILGQTQIYLGSFTTLIKKKIFLKKKKVSKKVKLRIIQYFIIRII